MLVLMHDPVKESYGNAVVRMHTYIHKCIILSFFRLQIFYWARNNYGMKQSVMIQLQRQKHTLGGHALQELNPQMMYEVHVAISRFVYKAGQWIYNFITNLAEKLDTCALQI